MFRAQRQAAYDLRYEMRGTAGVYTSAGASLGLDVSVIVQHAGTDEQGQEFIVKVRRSQVVDEPLAGSRFVVEGKAYEVVGMGSHEHGTNEMQWAVHCMGIRRPHGGGR